MKKVFVLGLLFFSLVFFSGAVLFLKGFSDTELVMFSASVGNQDDCEIGGSTKTKAAGDFIWWYFNLPGVSESYVEAGNSFVSPAFESLICKEGQPGHAENTSRIKRLVLHAKKYGQSIDHVGESRFNLLHAAVIHSDVDLFKFLIKEGADPSAVTRDDAVWYGKAYPNLPALELVLALRENNWPVKDAIIELLEKN